MTTANDQKLYVPKPGERVRVTWLSPRDPTPGHTLGEVVTVHGVVRWDAGHYDRELLPVDWVSP